MKRAVTRKSWPALIFGWLLGGELNALLENVEGYVGFLLVDDERWAETDAGFAAAEDEEAALEG